MDEAFFLENRIAFIRQFYSSASLSFTKRIRKIAEGEEPFAPPYDEEDEPPFLNEWDRVNEWNRAEESLHVVGCACISLLAGVFHLYLKTWVAKLGVAVGDEFKAEFKKGWLNGYRAYFAARFGLDFETAPVNLSLLEEVVLLRNRIQHPDDIANLRIKYSSTDLDKLPRPLFVDEQLLVAMDENETSWLVPTTVDITEEKLMTALKTIEKFSLWFEAEIATRVHSR